MIPARLTVLVCLLCLACLGSLPAQNREVVDTFVDGSIRARYTINAKGEKTGAYLRYHRNGKVRSRSQYAAGKLHGPHQEYHRDGSRKLACAYREGKLHGEHKLQSRDGKRVTTTHYKAGIRHGLFSVVENKRPLTRQVFKDGVLVELNGAAPFSVPLAELRATLPKILAAPAEVPGADQDPLLPQRLAALRRLQAYRYLCGLPYAGMELKPEWNELCDYGARLCQKIGRLDHTPKRPVGMDEESYRKGYRATSHSNLSAGASMERSVDNYMNDSDQRNIARVGHRRWCLNPAMKYTGFGQAGRYSAMWSFDGSGGGARGLEAVHYPPKGYIPVGFFGARHAWSIGIIRGPQAKKDDAKIRIVELDANYLETGKPLRLDYLNATSGGAGIGNCLIFRPEGLVVRPGKRYWCEVSLDGGKTKHFEYLVEFIDF